ncbi:hypothetical protein L1887_31874 [Cichorium endivia]|nr:hypothetical protein L1887_31874 [Cichorium endivia]
MCIVIKNAILVFIEIHNFTFDLTLRKLPTKLVSSDNHSPGVGLNLGSPSVGPVSDKEVNLGLSNKSVDHSDSNSPMMSKEIPDLNECALPSSSLNSDSVSENELNTCFSKRGKKTVKQGIHSMKFKEIIRTSSKGRQRARRKSEVASELANTKRESSLVASLNSISLEVEKTMTIGKDVGFRLENSRANVRSIIKGEGAFKKS